MNRHCSNGKDRDKGGNRYNTKGRHWKTKGLGCTMEGRQQEGGNNANIMKEGLVLLSGKRGGHFSDGPVVSFSAARSVEDTILHKMVILFVMLVVRCN